MSRTGLDAETLARSLRARAGDGSIEWVCEPIQTSVLLDIADMLDENAELRELVCWMYDRMDESCAVQYPYAPAPISYDRLMQACARARELGVGVD